MRARRPDLHVPEAARALRAGGAADGIPCPPNGSMPPGMAAWHGKLELCDGREALFGEAAAGAAVAAVRRRVSRALGWVPRR